MAAGSLISRREFLLIKFWSIRLNGSRLLLPKIQRDFEGGQLDMEKTGEYVELIMRSKESH